MKRRDAVLLALMIALTATVLVFPTSVSIRIGDDADRILAIGRLGYLQSFFSLRRPPEPDGRRLRYTAYSLGNNQQLLFWHDNQIHSIIRFRTEHIPGERYAKWHEIRETQEYVVNPPSPRTYLIGLALAFAGAYFSRSIPLASRVFAGSLIVFVLLYVAGTSILAGTFAIRPLLMCAGWIVAAMLGLSLSMMRQATRSQDVQCAA